MIASRDQNALSEVCVGPHGGTAVPRSPKVYIVINLRSKLIIKVLTQEAKYWICNYGNLV